MDNQKLFGLLLGYPECCIEQFVQESGFGRRSIGGYVPCDTHALIDDVSSILGRNPEVEPEDFTEFLETELSYEEGLEIYSRYGRAEFFKKCWEAA